MIAAVVLAAGLSQRMGRPKLVLPWGDTTVIGRVVQVLEKSGIAEIRVITGSAREEVTAALRGTSAVPVFNPRFREDRMDLSLCVGLRSLPGETEAAVVALGDQPHIRVATVRSVLAQYRQGDHQIISPSYKDREGKLHRGHPWLIARALWDGVCSLQDNQTLRDFLDAHIDRTFFIPVEDPSILEDLDTPEDYHRSRPDKTEK